MTHWGNIKVQVEFPDKGAVTFPKGLTDVGIEAGETLNTLFHEVKNKVALNQGRYRYCNKRVLVKLAEANLVPGCR